MKKLSLLILCLLVTCKVFTQTDTLKNKYVFLTETQAKSNIKELMAFDALQEIAGVQNDRLHNYKLSIDFLEKVVKTQDSIITEKDNIIELKDKIINAKKPLEIHTYIGASVFNFDVNSLGVYGKAVLELRKFNLGLQANYLINDFYELPNLYYTINVEYKIF